MKARRREPSHEVVDTGDRNAPALVGPDADSHPRLVDREGPDAGHRPNASVT